MNIKSIRLIASNFLLKRLQSEDEREVMINPKVMIAPEFKPLHEGNQEGSLTLGVLIDAEEIPFRIEVRYRVDFTLTDAHEIENAERFARQNLSAMLFPYVRCEISDRTMKGDFQPLFIQPINFVALYREHMKVKQQSETPSESTLSHDSEGKKPKGRKETKNDKKNATGC